MGRMLKLWYYDLKTSHYVSQCDKAKFREVKARADYNKNLELARHSLRMMEEVSKS